MVHLLNCAFWHCYWLFFATVLLHKHINRYFLQRASISLSFCKRNVIVQKTSVRVLQNPTMEKMRGDHKENIWSVGGYYQRVVWWWKWIANLRKCFCRRNMASRYYWYPYSTVRRKQIFRTHMGHQVLLCKPHVQASKLLYVPSCW